MVMSIPKPDERIGRCQGLRAKYANPAGDVGTALCTFCMLLGGVGMAVIGLSQGVRTLI